MEPKHPRTRTPKRCEKLHRSSSSLSRRNGHLPARWLSVKIMPSHLFSFRAPPEACLVSRACLHQQTHESDGSQQHPGRPGGCRVQIRRPRFHRIGVTTALRGGPTGCIARSPHAAPLTGGAAASNPRLPSRLGSCPIPLLAGLFGGQARLDRSTALSPNTLIDLAGTSLTTPAHSLHWGQNRPLPTEK